MITRKGLTTEDVFALISETGMEASIIIGIPECEKFTVTKEYSSRSECQTKLQADIDSFIASHAATTFTIHAEESEKEEVVNDSWEAIFKDATSGVKGTASGYKDKFASRFRSK